jgi:phage terminase large subunit-like protein
VSDLCAAFGLELDEWQEEVLRAGLGERSDGRWAARQVGCSTPRQNGKTMLIVARVLAGLLLFEEQLIIVSAHRQDTARETFFRLVQIIDESPDLKNRVDFIARSEMREFIRLKSGQEVRFKARSSGSGRGFSSDCLLLDEAQILGAAAWSAILPTMSARPNPQVWLFGTDRKSVV